jgi:iron complex outermembrane receptor protein
MGNLKGEGWRGNVGVRVVNTKIETTAWRVGVSAGTPGAINNPFGLMVQTTGGKEYTDILPSANFSFDVRTTWCSAWPPAASWPVRTTPRWPASPR